MATTDPTTVATVAASAVQDADVRWIDMDQIVVTGNVRDLDADHVENLAGSIKTRGQLVAINVRPVGEKFELVAGRHRYAANQRLGRAQILADIRDTAEVRVDRAVENIARKQLNAHEEARALRDALDDGLTLDGAAQALGWSKARASARQRLLELPEAAQIMIGRGEIPLSAVERLRSIGAVSSEILDVVVAYLAASDAETADTLVSSPSWVIEAALREHGEDVWAAHLAGVDAEQIKSLRLGKKTEALYERAGELAQQLDRYAYGPFVRFAGSEIDQARAAGVLLELEGRYPIIVDRGLYRELAKDAVKRTVPELEARIAQRAEERKADRQHTAASRAEDPGAEARRDAQRELRDLGRQAHGVNLDLGAGVLGGLATVDPGDMDVARFFVYALLGPDHSGGYYGGQASDRVVRLAMTGIRLVIDEFRTDETKTLKSGEPGALRITYGEAHDPEAALKWMWRFIDGARSAGELYGRALAVIAAEQYACRLVVPQSQRSHPTSWGSHKDRAAKALTKLAKPHLPATLTQLQKAIDRAHAAEWGRPTPSSETRPVAGEQADETEAQVGEDIGEGVDEDELVDEDLAD